jgi:hypothetical protein
MPMACETVSPSTQQALSGLCLRNSPFRMHNSPLCMRNSPLWMRNESPAPQSRLLRFRVSGLKPPCGGYRRRTRLPWPILHSLSCAGILSIVFPSHRDKESQRFLAPASERVSRSCVWDQGTCTCSSSYVGTDEHYRQTLISRRTIRTLWRRKVHLLDVVACEQQTSRAVLCAQHRSITTFCCG